MPRVLTVCLLAGALVAGAAAASVAPGSGRDRCARSSIEVVAQSPQALAFRRSRGTRTFICERSSGRTRHIGQLCVAGRCIAASCFDSCVHLDAARMAGTLFAYAYTTAGRGGATYRVRLLSVPTGREIGGWPTGPLTAAEAAAATYYNEGIGPVTDLVVRDDGSTAWIALHSYQHGVREVHVVKAGGADTVLARGRTIRQRSLKLQGSTLSWVQARQRRSVQLAEG